MIRILFNYILPFLLGCLVGTAAFYLVAPVGVPVPENVPGAGWGSGSGSGSGSCKSEKALRRNAPATFDAVYGTIPFTITSKPRATYTDAARLNNTEGSVLLKVTLLASGEVGQVSVVRGLPDGLSEQAVAAAKKIEFQPKRVDGRPVSTTVAFEYSFDIY